MATAGYNSKAGDASTTTIGLFRPVQSYVPPDQVKFTTLKASQDDSESGNTAMKCSIFTTEPRIKLISRFLSADEAEQLLRYAEDEETSWVPTSILRSVDALKYSSATCILRSEQFALAARLRDRFATVSGVKVTQVEELHLVRLQDGQSHRAVADGRHRVMSGCAYLHDVAEGGETRFTKLGVQFVPQRCSLVMWPNLESLEDGSTEIDWRTLREEFPAVHGTKYIIQFFANIVLDKLQQVHPGYERLAQAPASAWWSFPSLGDRYACDLHLQKLAQTYENSKGLLVVSSGHEPFLAVKPNFLEPSLLQGILQLLQVTNLSLSPRLLKDCCNDVTKDDAKPDVVSMEAQIKARVSSVCQVEPNEVEDIIVEHFAPGQHMAEQHAGPHRAYSVLIYLSGLDSASPQFPATTQFRHIPARIRPMQNSGLVWSNLTQDGRTDPRMRRCELPVMELPRYQLICHVLAGQNGAFGPAFKRGQWSVIPPSSAAGTPKLMIGPGQDFETSDDVFQPCPWLFRAPYLAVLKFLRDGEFLTGLPMTSESLIHVNVPFCAAFPECVVLADFLFESLRSQANQITILGAEYDDKADVGWWRRKERFVTRNYSAMSLKMEQMDLATETLPSCSFAIALHPEATKDGPWPAIIQNVFRSVVAGGVCVFCTFSKAEVHSVLRTLDQLGASREVHENPFWHVHPVPTPTARGILDTSGGGGLEPVAPYMRYIIVAKGCQAN